MVADHGRLRYGSALLQLWLPGGSAADVAWHCAAALVLLAALGVVTTGCIAHNNQQANTNPRGEPCSPEA
jgi:hypothetical protein